jgi:hypothetical protein
MSIQPKTLAPAAGCTPSGEYTRTFPVTEVAPLLVTGVYTLYLVGPVGVVVQANAATSTTTVDATRVARFAMVTS